MYSPGVADTTIKITDEVRDRLRILAKERGTSTRNVVETLIAQSPTNAEREERTARALAYVRTNLCPNLSNDDVARAQQWHADIAAGRLGDRR
jgi:predicted transcriptional regulator